MKVLTLVGTRPELIRLCIIIEKLDQLVEHTFVYTNQNYDPNLSTIFFKELGIRHPNYYFNFKSSKPDYFLAEGFNEFSDVLDKEKPDKVLVLGDTNSGLLAMLAAKRGIPVYHMEAGNRCFDERVPEETNRRIIDSFSKYNLPYTENSKQNLLSEGFHKNYVFKTGNPIFEVLNKFSEQIDNSDVLSRFNLKSKSFVLVTAHRSENVDNPKSLIVIMEALEHIASQHKVIFSVHPRTRSKLDGFKVVDDVVLSDPLGFFDFVHLEKTAKVVISDSGTVQEECCIYGVPSITIRKTTERQETIECGSNILTGIDFTNIKNAFKYISLNNTEWFPPKDYIVKNVSDIIINILLGN